MTTAELLNNKNKEVFDKLLTILESQLKILPDKPEETPESALRTLWHFSNNQPLSCAAAVEIPLTNLGPEGLDTLTQLVDRRVKGDPLAYIVGRQRFMGLELLSDPSALIPRRETELLANVCLEHIQEISKSTKSPLVLDHFTGSGNLPLCFADRYRQAKVYGADISEEAINLARANTEKLGLNDIAEFRLGDLFSPFEDDEFIGNFDLISGAPPYISSAKVPEMADEISNHEPSLAFEAGPFGVSLFTRLIKESPRFLRSGGWLAFEVGLGQGKSMCSMLERNKNYESVQGIKDEAGDIRVVAARRV